MHVLLSVSMPVARFRWRQDQVRLLLPSGEIYGPAPTVRRAPLVDSLAYKQNNLCPFLYAIALRL